MNRHRRTVSDPYAGYVTELISPGTHFNQNLPIDQAELNGGYGSAFYPTQDQFIPKHRMKKPRNYKIFESADEHQGNYSPSKQKSRGNSNSPQHTKNLAFGNLMFTSGADGLKTSTLNGSNYARYRQRNLEAGGNQARKSFDHGQFKKTKTKRTPFMSGGKGSSIEQSSEPRERPLSSKHYSASLKDRRRMVQYANR